MIDINHVSMKFSVANDRLMSLKEYALAAVKGNLQYKDFWAFKDVSFHVDKGDVVGIVGRNGAGKSTILKIISGVLAPTEGNVEVHGNIVPMLELGSGFDYELSGRENIFLNGAILGYDEEFLKEKYDEIVEFSEIGEFIENPIRNYSSGMLMRLAFSIATIVEPEILIVDEILAVGDEAFQKKSKQKMLSLMGGGATVLFVSHNIGQIREMCNKVAWLEGGSLRMFGNTKKVCDAYQEYINPPQEVVSDSQKGLFMNSAGITCKDVLYIYGNRADNYYWRVGIEKEQLLAVNILCEEVYYENIDFNLIDQYRVFIFVECPYNKKIDEFIQLIHEKGKVTFINILSEEDIQKEIIINCKQYIDEIITIDEELGAYFSKYGDTYVNPYVTNDRLAQLATWAVYDRDELPFIDETKIDSEDMRINYNRAVLEKKERERGGLRIGCFNIDFADYKYKDFKGELTAYVKEKNAKLYILKYQKDVDFTEIGDNVIVYEQMGFEEKPRIFSQMDVILHVRTKQEELYREKIIAALVKTKFCEYDLENGTYEICEDIDGQYCSVRQNAAVYSGYTYANHIRQKWNENFVFLTDLEKNELRPEIIDLIKELKSQGKDVILLDESAEDRCKEIAGYTVPVLSKPSLYIYATFDHLIALSWEQYDYLLHYMYVVNKYYYVSEIATGNYDDGDYSKFRANQTYANRNDISILTDDIDVKTALKTKYGVDSRELREIWRNKGV